MSLNVENAERYSNICAFAAMTSIMLFVRNAGTKKQISSCQLFHVQEAAVQRGRHRPFLRPVILPEGDEPTLRFAV
jgi:hypothetical protein